MAAADGPFTAFTRNSDSVESFAGGTTIFAEGEKGDCLYIVQTGAVDLLRAGHLLETVGPGNAFGEMVLTGRPERSASAVAREDTTAVRVDQEQFDRVMGLNPFLARAFMRLIAERLYAMDERLGSLR